VGANSVIKLGNLEYTEYPCPPQHYLNLSNPK